MLSHASFLRMECSHSRLTVRYVKKLRKSVPNHYRFMLTSSECRQVCVQPPTPAVNVTLPAFADERRAAGAVRIDRYILPSERSAANLSTAVAAVDRWDRPTDRQTDARPFHRPCSAYYAGSVKQNRQGVDGSNGSNGSLFGWVSAC